MTKTITDFQNQNQAAQIRSLETKVSQIASLLSERQPSSLSSTSEMNLRREGKEQCNAIMLRSGKEIKKPKRGVAIIQEKGESDEKDKPKKKAKEAIPPLRESTLAIPFLWRLK